MSKRLGPFERGNRGSYYDPPEDHVQYVVYTCDRCGDEVELAYTASFFFRSALESDIANDSLLPDEGWEATEDGEYICEDCRSSECARCGATITPEEEGSPCECGATLCEDCGWDPSACKECMP